MLSGPKRIIRGIRLIWRLMRDPRIPGRLKLLPFFAMAYLAFPLDLLFDRIPFIGWIDDLLALGVGFWAFVKLSPAAIVQEHLSDMDSISVQYKIDGETRKGDKGSWK